MHTLASSIHSYAQYAYLVLLASTSLECILLYSRVVCHSNITRIMHTQSTIFSTCILVLSIESMQGVIYA